MTDHKPLSEGARQSIVDNLRVTINRHETELFLALCSVTGMAANQARYLIEIGKGGVAPKPSAREHNLVGDPSSIHCSRCGASEIYEVAIDCRAISDGDMYASVSPKSLDWEAGMRAFNLAAQAMQRVHAAVGHEEEIEETLQAFLSSPARTCEANAFNAGVEVAAQLVALRGMPGWTGIVEAVRGLKK